MTDPAPLDPGRVSVRRLRIRLGHGVQAFDALNAVDVEIEAGAFICVLGPSGCGKSTLLGALAGHLQPAEGEILVDGQPVRGPHPERGLVFQQHTLFPWLKLVDNVAFGPKMSGVGKAQRREQALAALDLVGLRDFADFHPAQLSGGMQQRAEIARVLINRPRVLLMDEPFGALDAQTRAQMQAQLLDAWTRVRTTVIFITHDVDEALFLADRVLVLSSRPGRVIADLPIGFGRPRDPALVTAPDFVALKRRCIDLLAAQTSLSRLSPLGVH
jgi:NitT/TauT family transport system ATP-binding protein